MVVVIAINLLGGDDSDSSGSEASGGNAALSESELVGRAGSLEHTAYWVGPQSGTESY